MSIRALLIDDDSRLAELLATYLAPHDVRLAHAADGPSGLRAVAQGGVDIVVLDIMMPGMDGLDVLRRLRQTSALPVVMLTARGDETDRVVGLDLGADDYLAKLASWPVVAPGRSPEREQAFASADPTVRLEGTPLPGVRHESFDWVAVPAAVGAVCRARRMRCLRAGCPGACSSRRRGSTRSRTRVYSPSRSGWCAAGFGSRLRTCRCAVHDRGSRIECVRPRGRRRALLPARRPEPAPHPELLPVL